MSRRDQDVRDAILAAMPGDLAAVPLSQIEARLRVEGVAASRRTLQRHLAVLEQEGRAIREGRSVATTYRRADIAMATGDGGIIRSEAGRAVLELVSRPAIARWPVTCNQEFLDGYAPNTTFHLPEPLRSQLHDMGRTGDSTRPAGTRPSPPPRLIEGGLPTEAFLAWLVVSKYADALPLQLPLYRIAQILARSGVGIDRSTLANRVGRTAFHLEPIVQHMLGQARVAVWKIEETHLRHRHARLATPPSASCRGGPVTAVFRGAP